MAARKKTIPKRDAATAPKPNAAPPSGSKKEVVVGRLSDWPLARRLGALMSLPADAMDLACLQVVGKHGDAAYEAMMAKEERISPAVEPLVYTLLGVLDVCASDRGEDLSFTSAFHGSEPVDEMRARLGETYTVRTPLEALHARRPTPARSLARLERALEHASLGNRRKGLFAYLEGGPLKEGLTEIHAHEVWKGCQGTWWPEAFAEPDTRMLFLFAYCAGANAQIAFPATKELGFDRLAAHVDTFAAAGVEPSTAEDFVLVHNAATARFWGSTGVRAWECLRADPEALVERTLADFGGPARLADLFLSVLWFPKAVLDSGARDLVREVMNSPALVPDDTVKRVLADEEGRTALGAFERRPGPARSDTRPASQVTVGSLARFPGPEIAARRLTDLLARS